MDYPEFKARYNIIAAKAVAKAKSAKDGAKAVMEALSLDKEKYRLGHTKVFFRAGVAGWMEEQREGKIGSVLAWLQAGARGKASRMQFKKLQRYSEFHSSINLLFLSQKLALYTCQRAIRNMQIAKTWPWMQIWMFIKPNLKCTHFLKFQAQFENQIAEAESNIGSATMECEAVQKKHEALIAERDEMKKMLDGGADAVKDIVTKTERLEASLSDVQRQVEDVHKKVKAEEDVVANINQSANKVSASGDNMRKQIKELEGKLEKVNEEKAAKDEQIHTLRDEVANQEEMVAKLQKEKKEAGGGKQKTEENIQQMEDRCNHLNKVKGKLEQTLDETEDALEREKKIKNDIEKLKRKIEGDVKLTQEAVGDLERAKLDLSTTLMRKEKELQSLAAKIEDEGTLAGKYNKQVKELQTRTDELEEELLIERQNRAKAEKSRTTLSRDIQDLGSRLEEAGSNTTTQIEMNKRREQELLKLKGELEVGNTNYYGLID